MPARQYFAQVGTELIQVPAEHVDLQHGGARFSTSAPVRFYRVRTLVNETLYEADGDSWKAAEADLAKQLPKEQS